MIKVLFFASLREQLACQETVISAEELSNNNINTIELVIAFLIAQNPQWQNAFNSSVLSAVNQEMVNKTHPVNLGDEVAFFPPVTGG